MLIVSTLLPVSGFLFDTAIDLMATREVERLLEKCAPPTIGDGALNSEPNVPSQSTSAP